MSFQWTSYILQNRRDLKGPHLLCALIIANYASADDRCYPGLQRISEDMRTTLRSTQRIIRSLEEKKVFRIVSGNGRGSKTSFELLKGDETVALSEAEIEEEAEPAKPTKRATGTPPFNLEEGRHRRHPSEHEKGDISGNKGRHSAPKKPAHIRNEPFKPILERERAAAERGPTRKDHPAIIAVREVTNAYPKKVLWDGLVEVIGDAPELEKLQACYIAWVARGYNPQNYAWLTEWYVHGIPQYSNGSRPGPPKDADCLKCGNERRIRGTLDSWPCEECRPAEHRAWLKERGKL